MKKLFLLLLFSAFAIASSAQSRAEAEYYAAAYAAHYGIPLDFLSALITQESDWQPCAVSRKGAIGLMQLMPSTAREMHVTDLCDLRANISAGVRRLAWLQKRFDGDLRLVAAAYFAGEPRVTACGLSCSNPEIVTYVTSIRKRVSRARLSAPFLDLARVR
jgi:soluble lytic murein transglycosylase-like protein